MGVKITQKYQTFHKGEKSKKYVWLEELATHVFEMFFLGMSLSLVAGQRVTDHKNYWF